ncbi:MAG: S8 family serine peptidase, partial [Thaumarchaeota archaeon]|nr:S8 family serine peptidase [Nitrososphaerota archaeon]
MFLPVLPVQGLDNPHVVLRAPSTLNSNLPVDEYPKIDSKLLAMSKSSPDEMIQAILELTEADPEYIEALETNGLIIQSTHNDLVQALVNREQITSLQESSLVRSVSLPQRPLHLVTSQGVNVIQANLAAQNGLSGKGVKVAVIDIGFDTANSEIAGNIKEARSFRADGSITGGDPNHGTAVAEIIVDVAPEAELYLYNFGTLVEFLNVLDYAADRGVKVLSASIGWVNAGPYDGTSRVSKAIDTLKEKGVLPVVSAGNSARRHWSGIFIDTDSDSWHEFNGLDETNGISLDAGDKISIFLSWDDWPESCQDYDLYLYDDRRDQALALSERRQSCTRSPTEEIEFTVPSGGTYHIAIWKYAATEQVKFDLFVFDVAQLEYYVEAGSIGNMADAGGAFTVGAVDWRNDALESYSSRGPTADGRVKPDVVAPTCVATLTYGSREFCGTSASAPHVAGAAAII